MWPTTMGLSDKEFQMCSDPRIRALLITRDGGGGICHNIETQACTQWGVKEVNKSRPVGGRQSLGR